MIPDTDIGPGAILLWDLDFIATLLSGLGSSWMIYSILKLPSPKSISLKLVLAIAVSDLFYTIANFMSNLEDDETVTLCITEAILRESSFLYTILFSVCLSIASYKITTNPGRKWNQNLFFLLSVLFGLFMILSTIIIVPYTIIKDSIVLAHGPFFCWFSYSLYAEESKKILVILLYKGFPIITGLLISIFAYVKAVLALRKLPKPILNAYNFNIYRLLWYPLVFFITFLPNLVDDLLRTVNPDRPLLFEALHLFLTHSIGFNNALVYGIQVKLYNTRYEDRSRKSISTVSEYDHEEYYDLDYE